MRLIKTTYETVTPESAEYGDYAETGWHDEEGIPIDPEGLEEGQTIPEAAAEILWDLGALEPSSSMFYPDTWYSSDPVPDYRTGDETTYSFHLEGFTEEEERDIYSLLMKKARG